MPLRKYTKGLFDAYDLVVSEVELKSILGFEKLFKEHPPKADAQGYEFVKIQSPESFDAIWRSKGLYMIASNFKPDLERREGCSLQIAGLPVIYRGHADLVRERVQSHLDNTRYVKMKSEKGQAPWTRCLKLDRKSSNGGIDFDACIYRDFRWVVLVLPLRNSTTKFRNCAEWDSTWCLASPSHPTKRPKAQANLPWTKHVPALREKTLNIL